ncbi:MAG: hypothetical protein ABL973_18580 [Micropepsaceae bacterium]
MNTTFAAGALIASMMTLASSPTQAKPIKVSDPEVAMRAAYAALEKESQEVELPLSARLAGLFALDEHETGKDEVGRIDFDYFVNGQDSKVSRSKVSIRTVENGPARRIVVVRFKNFDQEMENHFFWEKAKTGWVLDDVRFLDGKEGYTLSLVLKYGWDGPEELNQSGQ